MGNLKELDKMCGKMWTDAGSQCGTHYCMIKGKHDRCVCRECRKPKK